MQMLSTNLVVGGGGVLNVLVVLPLPSRSLELRRLQRHKPSTWQWAPLPVPIEIYRTSVTALSHWPPEVSPLRSCYPRCPPSRLWCNCCELRSCSCLVGWAALRCLAGRCRWAAIGDQRCVKTNKILSRGILRFNVLNTFRSMISFASPL